VLVQPGAHVSAEFRFGFGRLQVHSRRRVAA
jgi:hypothetical protein